MSAQQVQVPVTQQPGQTVVVVGGCPKCGVGQMSDRYTGLGICLAICFFPIGILCCCMMKQKKCDRCGASVDS